MQNQRLEIKSPRCCCCAITGDCVLVSDNVRVNSKSKDYYNWQSQCFLIDQYSDEGDLVFVLNLSSSDPAAVVCRLCTR